MTFARFDDHLSVANFFDPFREQRAELFADGSVDPTGAAICDDTLRVERAKVCAGSNVAGLEIDAEPERLDHSATDFKFEWIVAEEPKMSGTAARSDARRNRNHATLGRVLRERVEVRSGGCFERSCR